MVGVESIQSGLQEALLPANDGRSTGVQPVFDGVEGGMFSQHEDQLGTEDVPGWQGTRLGNAAEFQLLLLGEPDFVAWGHTNLEACQSVMVTLRQTTRTRPVVLCKFASC